LQSRHKLSIRADPNFPKVWYKDEGGRDKFININAVLVDEHNAIVLEREVPLRVVLTYEGDSDNEVKNQSILKLSNDSTPNIGRNGMVTLKVRIEEVSKNHQKQSFCVKIAPDTSYSPANYDIAIDVSPAITVKSKRNKRNRKELKGGAYADKKSKLDASSHMAASSLLDMAGPLAADNLSQQMAKLRNSNNQGDFQLFLHMTRSWCQFVVDSMKSMEWQHVGFEVMEGGQLNLHRPLYRCPGCWAYKDTLREPRHRPDCVIQKALQTYNKCAVDESMGKIISVLTSGAATPAASRRGASEAAALSSGRGARAAGASAAAAASASSSMVDGLDRSLKASLNKAWPPPPPNSTPRIPSMPPPSLSIPSVGAASAVPSPTILGGPRNKVPRLRGLPAGLQPVSASQPILSLGFLKDRSDVIFQQAESESSSVEESCVASILVAQTEHGFPAFDSKDKLSGFYVYDDKTMVITFFPLANYKALSTTRIEEIQQALQKNKEEGSSTVVTKETEITLAKMKDQVMLSIFEIIGDAKDFWDVGS